MSADELSGEKMMTIIMSEDKMPEYVKFYVKMEIDKMIRFLLAK